MNHIVFAFTAVFPLFALAAVGYAMRRLHWFDGNLCGQNQ